MFSAVILTTVSRCQTGYNATMTTIMMMMMMTMMIQDGWSVTNTHDTSSVRRTTENITNRYVI